MKTAFDIETKQKVKRFCAKIFSPRRCKRASDLSVILNYHSIHPTNIFSTKPSEFQRQMQYLRNEFNVISLKQFYKIRIGNIKLPDRTAIITFDDGYEDNYRYAFPIIARYNIPATIFLTTGFINNECDITQQHFAYRGLRPLRWKNIIEMNETGLSFGAHTHTHPILTNICLKKAGEEISKSKIIIEKNLAEPVEMFAYPLGQRHTFNKSIEELLRCYGFEAACSTIWGTDNAKTNILSLHRVRIDAQDTFDDFRSKVNGRWDFIKLFQKIR